MDSLNAGGTNGCMAADPLAGAGTTSNEAGTISGAGTDADASTGARSAAGLAPGCRLEAAQCVAGEVHRQGVLDGLSGGSLTNERGGSDAATSAGGDVRGCKRREGLASGLDATDGALLADQPVCTRRK
jgi:hypothetical protein